jgi:hypothetical protein
VAGPENSTVTRPVVEPIPIVQERIGSDAVMQPYDDEQIRGDPMNARKRSRLLNAKRARRLLTAARAQSRI